jgi:hypothetical protein
MVCWATPAGAATFGPWQPGYVVVIEAPTRGQQPPSHLYLYETTFAAWSPDGRYFADGLSIRGLLRPAGLPLPTLALVNTSHLGV